LPHRCRLVDVTVALKAQPPTSSPRQTTPLTHLSDVLPVNDRKRSPILQRKVILCPVPGLVLRRCPAAHSGLLSHWIYVVNPTRDDLCNKAVVRRITRKPRARSLSWLASKPLLGSGAIASDFEEPHLSGKLLSAR
jgi:hypothetical protein